MAETYQDLGKLSIFGARLKIHQVVSLLAWSGCIFSFCFFLTGSAILILHCVTEPDQRGNSTFSALAAQSQSFRLKLIKLFNPEDGNSTAQNSTAQNSTAQNSKEVDSKSFALFCSIYGIYLLFTFLFVVYFCLLIKAHSTRDKAHKQNVAKYIRRFCYFIAASKILLGFRYSLVYYLEYTDDDQVGWLENDERKMIALFGMAVIIFLLDIIVGFVILFGIRKVRKAWITGVLCYVILVFLFRLGIFLYWVVTDKDKEHIVPLCLHIYFFSFSYMFLVIQHGLMGDGSNSNQADSKTSETVVMKPQETEKTLLPFEMSLSVESIDEENKKKIKVKDNTTAMGKKNYRNGVDIKCNTRTEKKKERKVYSKSNTTSNIYDEQDGRNTRFDRCNTMSNNDKTRADRQRTNNKDEKKDKKRKIGVERPNTRRCDQDQRQTRAEGKYHTLEYKRADIRETLGPVRDVRKCNTMIPKGSKKSVMKSTSIEMSILSRTNEELEVYRKKNIGGTKSTDIRDKRRMTMETGAKVTGWIEEGGQRYWGIIRDGALYLYKGQNYRANNEKPRETIQLKEGRRENKVNIIMVCLKSGEKRRFQVEEENIHNWNLALDGSFGEKEDIYENMFSSFESEPENENEKNQNQEENDYITY